MTERVAVRVAPAARAATDLAGGGGAAGLLLAMGGRRQAASWWGRWWWVVRVLGGVGAVAAVLALVYRRLFNTQRTTTRSTTAPALPPATRRPAAATTSAPARDAVTAPAGEAAKRATTEDRGALPLSAVRGRRLTCSTRGVVLELDSATHQPRMIESAVPMLLRLARHTDLYLITECDDDGVEEAVRRLFAERGLLDGGINPHKVLFCGTAVGRIHMARQLESHMHIDGDEAVAEGLGRHIARLAVVGAPPTQTGGGGTEGMRWAQTLSELFEG